jgi:hypothetical protein
MMIGACDSVSHPGAAGQEGGGVHFFSSPRQARRRSFGSRSSAWGRGSSNGYVRGWRATANGLEGAVASANDAAAILDEVGAAMSASLAAPAFETPARSSAPRGPIAGTHSRAQESERSAIHGLFCLTAESMTTTNRERIRANERVGTPHRHRSRPAWARQHPDLICVGSATQTGLLQQFSITAAT